MVDDAALDLYAEALHQKRCDRAAESGDRPSFVVEPWADRPEHLKEIDRSMASVVAAMAMHDAAFQSEADAMELARFRAHLPVVLDALRVAVASGGYEYERKRFVAALGALGGGKGQP
jgi:hypothetical protein